MDSLTHAIYYYYGAVDCDLNYPLAHTHKHIGANWPVIAHANSMD